MIPRPRPTSGVIMTLLLATACAQPRSSPGPAPAGSLPELLGPPPPRAQLLLVGVFHFADPGLDGYRPRFRVDITSPESQRQVEEVAGLLSRFQPTRIAVEWPKTEQARLDSLYGAYLEGREQLGSNEVYQLGFRLARRLGLARVHAVDVSGRSPLTDDEARAMVAALGMNVDSVLGNDPWQARYRRLYEYEDSLKTVRPLRQYLLRINEPERIRLGHGHYLVGPFKLARGDNYVGVDDVTRWYHRNLRIFSNIQQLTRSPDDRVLVIIGAGHLPILRFLAETSPEHRLVEVAEYLGSR